MKPAWMRYFLIAMIFVTCVFWVQAFAFAKTYRKVWINQASLEELQFLPGVGPSKAKAILKYREKRAFKSIKDLRRIKGIGPKMSQKMEAWIIFK